MRALWYALLLGLAVAPAVSAAETFEEAMVIYDAAAASGKEDHPGYAKARKTFVELASRGHAGAKYHLGLLYYFGIGGVVWEPWKARDLIRAAADDSYGVAQSWLGFNYERGDTDVYMNDPKLARQWWERGAASSHCTAIRRMAQAYAMGELGVKKDDARADELKARLPTCRKR